MVIRLLLLLFLVLTLLIIALPAEDGSLGSTSSGSIHIGLTIPPRVATPVIDPATGRISVPNNAEMETVQTLDNKKGTKVVILQPKL